MNAASALGIGLLMFGSFYAGVTMTEDGLKPRLAEVQAAADNVSRTHEALASENDVLREQMRAWMEQDQCAPKAPPVTIYAPDSPGM